MLYQPNTTVLKDTTVDATFSEWVWVVLWDGSSPRTLSVKLFTNSRKGGLHRLTQYMNEAVCLTDLIALTTVVENGANNTMPSMHSMFARSTDMTDVVFIPSYNPCFPLRYNTDSFWWARTGNVIRAHERTAMELSLHIQSRAEFMSAETRSVVGWGGVGCWCGGVVVVWWCAGTDVSLFSLFSLATPQSRPQCRLRRQCEMDHSCAKRVRAIGAQLPKVEWVD
jgi:hypothetical protein